MLKRENESVKKIDKLILDMLKEKMKIKQERVSIMQDAEMKKVIKKINEKMEVICLLFHEDLRNKFKKRKLLTRNTIF